MCEGDPEWQGMLDQTRSKIASRMRFTLRRRGRMSPGSRDTWSEGRHPIDPDGCNVFTRLRFELSLPKGR